MEHDSKKGEKVAGLFHLGFAAMYVLTFLWHAKAAVDHWKRL